jgi:hypothetical protein
VAAESGTVEVFLKQWELAKKKLKLREKSTMLVATNDHWKSSWEILYWRDEEDLTRKVRVWPK